MAPPSTVCICKIIHASVRKTSLAFLDEMLKDAPKIVLNALFGCVGCPWITLRCGENRWERTLEEKNVNGSKEDQSLFSDTRDFDKKMFILSLKDRTRAVLIGKALASHVLRPADLFLTSIANGTFDRKIQTCRGLNVQ